MANAQARLAESVAAYRRLDPYSVDAVAAAQRMADDAEALLADLGTDTPGGDGV